MKIRLVFRLSSQTREEQLSFGAKYREYRDHIEEMVKQGAFGPPEIIEVHWLISTGRWE